MIMRRGFTILLRIIILMTLPLASCVSMNELLVTSQSMPEQTPDPPRYNPTSDISSEPVSEQYYVDNTADNTSAISFASMENAYYSKYVELAERYGTYSLYDYYRVKGASSERSYLNGVCIVNLMDFNGDGVQDLFVVYSNGQMSKTIYDNSDLEIYDFPAKDTYEFEIWTYTGGKLAPILHDFYVNKRNEAPMSTFGVDKNDYQIFITVYENKNGFPVIQIYDESDEGRNYTNIYYSDEQIIRDELLYNDNAFQMNGLAITEDSWSENVAGYHKILLCSLLADSSYSSTKLLEWRNIDYNDTLLQTESVVRYLSQMGRTPAMMRFHIAEGKYIALYLQELERANRVRYGLECTGHHYLTLYDIDQNGVPELILYDGSSGAGTHYHFFTIIDDEIIDCGYYGRTTLYANGEGGFIAYLGRMGRYYIDEITLEGSIIKITPIAEGSTNGGEYPELEAYGYEHYDYLDFYPPAIPVAIYRFNQEFSLH